jgi:hypothetical protein
VEAIWFGVICLIGLALFVISRTGNRPRAGRKLDADPALRKHASDCAALAGHLAGEMLLHLDPTNRRVRFESNLPEEVLSRAASLCYLLDALGAKLGSHLMEAPPPSPVEALRASLFEIATEIGLETDLPAPSLRSPVVDAFAKILVAGAHYWEERQGEPGDAGGPIEVRAVVSYSRQPKLITGVPVHFQPPALDVEVILPSGCDGGVSFQIMTGALALMRREMQPPPGTPAPASPVSDPLGFAFEQAFLESIPDDRALRLMVAFQETWHRASPANRPGWPPFAALVSYAMFLQENEATRVELRSTLGEQLASLSGEQLSRLATQVGAARGERAAAAVLEALARSRRP